MVYKAGKAPVIVILIIAMVTFLSGPIFADVFVASSVNYGTGVYPFEAVCGDFNNDGKLDVATANMRSISLLLGNGDGTFQAKSDIMLADASFSQSFWNITTGDFNNDGKLDIITKGADGWLGQTIISVLLGNGDGTFQTPKNYRFSQSSLHSITAGDFNGDGNLDIAMDYFSSVSVLLGNGDGSFQAKKDYAVGPNPVFRVNIADINGDGNIDIITGDWSSFGGNPGSTISVLLGNGDGTFSAGTVLDLGGFITDVVTGDLNGDGNVDIAAIKSETDTQNGSYIHNVVSVFIRNSDGTFQTRRDYVTGIMSDQGGGAIVAADINGDGKLDLVTASTMSVSIHIGNGDGTFQPTSNTVWVSGSYTYFFSLAAADFNKDGKLDLVATAERNHAMSIFINTTPNRLPVADAGHDRNGYSHATSLPG